MGEYLPFDFSSITNSCFSVHQKNKLKEEEFDLFSVFHVYFNDFCFWWDLVSKRFLLQLMR